MCGDTPIIPELNFTGPYRFRENGNSLFNSPFARSAGIYLWTVQQRSDSSHLIHYIGETTSFARRHREHLVQILGLNYGIFNPDMAQDGICELVWPGLWRDASLAGTHRHLNFYRDSTGIVLHYISILSVFFAELDIEASLRKHIEGCIGFHLRKNHPESKALYPDDNHVGTIYKKKQGEIKIASNEIIRGLDKQIPY